MNDGADPLGFFTGVAPSGMYAWRLLFSVMVNPRARDLAWIWSKSSWSNTSSRFEASATISRVRSSCVGPRPPDVITRSDRFMARSMTSLIRPGLSPTVVL